jgi:O-antigen ligase
MLRKEETGVNNMGLSRFVNRNLVIILICSLLMGVLVAYHQYLIYGLLLLFIFFLVLIKISYNYIYNLIVLLLPLMVYLHVGLTFNFSFSDLLLPIACLITLPIFIENKNAFSNKYSYLLFYLYLLTFALTISFIKPMFFSINEFELSTAISNIMKIVINFVYLYIFLIYFMNYEKTSDKSYTFLKVWNFISIIFSLLCIIGVILYYLGITTNLTFGFRATGTFEDPNLAASFLIISLGFCLSYNNSPNSNKKRIPINLLLILFALLLTSSRGGVLGLGVGFILVVLINLTNKGIKQIAKIVVFLIVLITIILLINYIYPLDIVNTSLGRISNISTEESGTNLRLLLWRTALTLWQDNPFLGVGFGQYLHNAQEINSSIVNIPHNTYLSFLAETGIIGFMSFFSLPIYLFYKLFIWVKKGEVTSIFLFVSLSGILVQAFTINLENFRCLWIFYAFILYWVHEGVERASRRENSGNDKVDMVKAAL